MNNLRENFKISVILNKNDNGKLIEVAKILGNQTQRLEINVIVIDNDNQYDPLNSSKSIGDMLKQQRCDVVLLEASAWGKDLAPRVAVELQTGLSADCTNLKIDDENNLIASRPAYNGQVFADIKCKIKPYIVTIKPEFFQNDEKIINKNFEIKKINLKIKSNDSKTKLIKYLRDVKLQNIANSKIIIAGGAGVKNKENFSLLEDLAQKIGGVVGASRYTVDKGWRPHSDLIGLTGRTIKPKIYIACGISGAAEHLVGIQKSETIIAINNDPNAPIFKVADYGIVGDLFEVIPKLIGLLR